MPQKIENRTRALPYRPRLVAVIDSDRKGPGDAESQDAQALRRSCNEHGLPCWVLAKREAENYLPRVLLSEKPNASAGHASIVEAWERLSNDQKNFFDMKRGLPEAPSEIEQDLFDGLPDADREILATGFGPNVHKCWDLWHVREVRNELLTRATRRSRGRHQADPPGAVGSMSAARQKRTEVVPEVVFLGKLVERVAAGKNPRPEVPACLRVETTPT